MLFLFFFRMVNNTMHRCCCWSIKNTTKNKSFNLCDNLFHWCLVWSCISLPDVASNKLTFCSQCYHMCAECTLSPQMTVAQWVIASFSVVCTGTALQKPLHAPAVWKQSFWLTWHFSITVMILKSWYCMPHVDMTMIYSNPSLIRLPCLPRNCGHIREVAVDDRA